MMAQPLWASLWAMPPKPRSANVAGNLRKDMQGLIFGPVDKNLNELWFCCPVLYRKAWDKAYAQTSDYQRIYPKIAKKTRGDTTAYKLEVTDNEGTAKDIVQLWERHYKKQGWDKLATYNKKGDFNSGPGVG